MADRARAVPVRRGDVVDLDVAAMADGPDALARVGGWVVLLPGALPGERVRAEITSAARKYGRARVLEVLQPSPERVPPRCRHFLRCGGCHLQHQRYEAQLEQKRARLQKELAFALGGAAPEVRAAVPAPAPFGQRHKVALHLLSARGGLVPALHGLRELGLVPLEECPASAPGAWALALACVRALDSLRLTAFEPETGAGLLRSVLVRRSAATGQSHLLVVASRTPVPGLMRMLPELHAAGATTISVNEHGGDPARLLGGRTEVLSGPRRIDERISGVTLCLSPDAFFQTSPAGAAALVDAVRGFLAPLTDDVIADLYCGGGLFTLALAAGAREAFGVEESAVAVADALAAARRNRARNVRFLRGPVERLLRGCRDGALPRPDLAVLDPPRAGALPEALRELAALGPRKVAFVGCEPRALARGVAVLVAAGYRIRAVQPVDMFPQTSHVEAVAMLERGPFPGAATAQRP
jgi:23S rRNA (uracil1939-C5)-methyltransferase